MQETWWEYVSRISGGAPQQDIAHRVGVDASRISGWKRGGQPSAQNAVAFARAYNRPAVEGLVAAAYLSPGEAGEVATIQTALADIPTEVILGEVRRRMDSGDNSQKWRWRNDLAGNGTGREARGVP
jgi:transcriptional regulator with XRE-family HTH domain